MVHIPNEIVGHTLSFLSGHYDRRTLRICALVGRVWRSFAQQLLFSDVEVTSPRVAQQIREVLETNGSLAKHVRTLMVDGGHPGWDVHDLVGELENPDWDEDEVVDPECAFALDPDRLRYGDMWGSAMVAEYLLKKCPLIKSVELSGGLPWPVPVHVLFTSPVLEQCTISGHTFLVSSTDAMPTPLVVPSSLLSLNLSSPYNYHQLASLDFKTLFSSPSIRRLTISGFKDIPHSVYLDVFRHLARRAEAGMALDRLCRLREWRRGSGAA